MTARRTRGSSGSTGRSSVSSRTPARETRRVGARCDPRSLGPPRCPPSLRHVETGTANRLTGPACSVRWSRRRSRASISTASRAWAGHRFARWSYRVTASSPMRTTAFQPLQLEHRGGCCPDPPGAARRSRDRSVDGYKLAASHKRAHDSPLIRPRGAFRTPNPKASRASPAGRDASEGFLALVSATGLLVTRSGASRPSPVRALSDSLAAARC